MVAFELFTPFGIFMLQCWLRNAFEMSNNLHNDQILAFLIPIFIES